MRQPENVGQSPNGRAANTVILGKIAQSPGDLVLILVHNPTSGRISTLSASGWLQYAVSHSTGNKTKAHFKLCSRIESPFIAMPETAETDAAASVKKLTFLAEAPMVATAGRVETS